MDIPHVKVNISLPTRNAADIHSIISVALSSRCTMDALLGLSASHLAWKTSNSDTEHLAYQHRSNAAKGLHEALGSLSEKNAEAVLVASVLLSWQAKDWYSATK